MRIRVTFELTLSKDLDVPDALWARRKAEGAQPFRRETDPELNAIVDSAIPGFAGWDDRNIIRETLEEVLDES
jgi:hypothetical protein